MSCLALLVSHQNYGTSSISFFTQNNGTPISAFEAKRLLIPTYLSGPINTLTGAAFLCREQGPFEKDVIVVDLSGTTTDTYILQPTGLPRSAAAFSLLSGVRTNFSVTDLCSIGLGGSSLVHVDEETGNVTVGPESVGYQLEIRSRIFGGPDLTVTDVVFAKRGCWSREICHQAICLRIRQSLCRCNKQGAQRGGKAAPNSGR